VIKIKVNFLKWLNAKSDITGVANVKVLFLKWHGLNTKAMVDVLDKRTVKVTYKQ
jgi:hypothetical protein